MSKRFGRNQKRKLNNEINQLKNDIRYMEYKSQPSPPLIHTSYSYNDLFINKPKNLDPRVAINVHHTELHLFDITSRIAVDERCHKTLITTVKLADNTFKHYINTELYKDLLRSHYPMEDLYKHIYEEFKTTIEKAVLSK